MNMNIKNKVETVSRGELVSQLNNIAKNGEIVRVANMIDHALQFTNDKELKSYSIKIRNKILGLEKLTYKEANTMYDLIYLYTLNAFFPYEYNSIDKIRKEYGFCNKYLN